MMKMNKSWNIGAAPLNEQVESYQCEHSIGFSRLQSECQGIESSWRIFVPQTGSRKCGRFDSGTRVTEPVCSVHFSGNF